jgi:hypothetical protein
MLCCCCNVLASVAVPKLIITDLEPDCTFQLGAVPDPQSIVIIIKIWLWVNVQIFYF